MPVPCRELQSRGRVGHLPLLDRCSVVSAAPPTLTGRESSGHHGMSESKSTAPGFRGLLRSVERPPLDGKEKKKKKKENWSSSLRGRVSGEIMLGDSQVISQVPLDALDTCSSSQVGVAILGDPRCVSHMLGGRGGDAGHHPRNLGAQA